MDPDHDCIFCKIASGQCPSATVLATDDALAFLDINPLADGHTLLIPRRHFSTLRDMTPKDAAPIVTLLPQLAAAVMFAAGVNDCNILQNNGPEAGQVVKHVHFHIIPRTAGDNLGFRWNAKSYPPGRLEQLQADINAHLNK